MNDKSIATIICLYKNDSCKNLRYALDSIINQEDIDMVNHNIYLGIDGFIGEELERLVLEYQPHIYKIIRNRENLGLAATLNKLIDSLEQENFVFRMDSDDISCLKRYKNQIDYLTENEDVSILGGRIKEFHTQTSENGLVRTYPLTLPEIKKYFFWGSPFAHPTVCFRKTLFDKGFRYPTKYGKNEDIGLWYDCIKNGIICANLSETILFFRVSQGLVSRRSIDKAISEFKLYSRASYDFNGISWKIIIIFSRFISRLLPKAIIKKLYFSRIRSTLNR